MTRSISKRNARNTTPGIAAFDRITELQIKLPILIIACLLVLHNVIPAATPLTGKFLHLQYCDSPRWYNSLGLGEKAGLCAKGRDDAYMVFTGLLLFTTLRASMMHYIYTPLGRSQGISRTKPLMRFAEQAWGLTWALTSWSCGMYLFYYSPYWLDISAFYQNWPEIRLNPTFKLYYLMQMAFWLQCILALNLEAKRKDYVQMFGHHVLSSTLLIGSYAFNTTRVGHTILTLMDFADIFLPLAKMLKYTGHQTLCDGTFVVFLISWIVTRHYLLGKIILSAHRIQPIKLKSGTNITWFFVLLLSGLEVLMCLWSLAIGRVLWGIFRGGNADDSRSDTEDSDHESTSQELDTPMPAVVNGGHANSHNDEAQSHRKKKKKS